MYKIIIADDNPLILMGMKNMIKWDQFHATLAGEARNGEQALKLVRELEPDLVITDIRMPGKDGLYLLEQLRLHYSQISTIVVSAYDEFHYAKEAMKAGSIDYILKPINPKELNAAIKKAYDRNQEKEWSYTRNIQSYSGGVLYALRTKENMEVSEISELLSDITGIEILKPNDFFLILSHEKNRSDSGIEKLLEKGLGERKLKDAFLLGRQEIKVDSDPEILWGKAIADAAGSFLQKPHREYVEIQDSEVNEEQILLFCTTGNAATVIKMFHNLVHSLEKESSSIFMEGVLNFLHYLLAIDKKTYLMVRERMKRVEEQQSKGTFFNLDELVEDVEALIELICQEFSRQEGSKKDLVGKVQEMIRKNYQSDLSLNEIARLFYVTPSYLSRIFKQETGTNLNNYITMIRMEKAKQLLEQTDEKVVNIAHLVGYAEPNYFTKVFKKYTGYSPSDKRTE